MFRECYKQASTPMDLNLRLSKQDGIPLQHDDITGYRRLVGRLLYL